MIIIAAAAGAITSPCAEPSPPRWCNSSLPPLTRAELLVQELTVEEKADVMTIGSGSPNKLGRVGLHSAHYTECSHASGSPHGNHDWAGNDWKVTVFPQVMTTARSFSRELVGEIAHAIGLEGRAKHNVDPVTRLNKSWVGEASLFCFAPMINLCRDPRWGRCQEGNGEDSFLGAELATEYVRGLQQPDERNPRMLKMIATPKHFSGFSGPTNMGGTDAAINRRDFLETFTPMFKAAIAGGRARSIMCSYSMTNGVPNCANGALFNATGLVRRGWNFTGHVVTDCGAIGGIFSRDHYAKSLADAAVDALSAGVDASCGGEYATTLPALLSNRSIAPAARAALSAAVDAAAVKVLTNRMLVGELEDDTGENPWRDLDLAGLLPAHAAVARRAARESIVLLVNRNATLPLDLGGGIGTGAGAGAEKETKQKRVLLVGPSADEPYVTIGDYAPQPPYYMTPAAGLRDSLVAVDVLPGCVDGVWCRASDPRNMLAIAQAVKAAREAGAGGARPYELVVYAGGTNGTHNAYAGEGKDRPDIQLPGRQEELLSKLRVATREAGVPLVVVLIHGAPVVSPAAFGTSTGISTGTGSSGAGGGEEESGSGAGAEEDGADAVLSAGFGGQELGRALAEVLLGVYDPSGRLVNTWYRNATRDLPPISDYDMRAKFGRTYKYLDAAQARPYFRFADGLSYASWRVSSLALLARGSGGSGGPSGGSGSIGICDRIDIAVTVSNTGGFRGSSDKTILAFISFDAATQATAHPPNIKLAAFGKLYNVSSGGSRRLALSIPADARGVLPEGHSDLQLLPGNITIHVGGGLPGGSESTVQAVVQVQGAAQPLAACQS